MNMIAALDIDGTASAWPGVVGRLAVDLSAAGWEVVYLTGHLHPDPDRADRVALESARRSQLALLGVPPLPVVVCVGRDTADVARRKGEYLRGRGVSLFVDDTEAYCRAARQLSPGTLTLKVF